MRIKYSKTFVVVLSENSVTSVPLANQKIFWLRCFRSLNKPHGGYAWRKICFLNHSLLCCMSHRLEFSMEIILNFGFTYPFFLFSMRKHSDIGYRVKRRSFESFARSNGSFLVKLSRNSHFLLRSMTRVLLCYR